MKVEVICAWPRRHAAVTLELPPGSTVGEAIAKARLPTDDVVAYAVHGVRAELSTTLTDGDRVELLRPLLADPKESRRRRAQSQRPGPR